VSYILTLPSQPCHFKGDLNYWNSPFMHNQLTLRWFHVHSISVKFPLCIYICTLCKFMLNMHLLAIIGILDEHIHAHTSSV
jgi:hypothetical protein